MMKNAIFSNRLRRRALLILLPIALLGLAANMVSKRPETLPIGHAVNAPIGVSSDGRFVATVDTADVSKIALFDRWDNRVSGLRSLVMVGSIFFTPDGKTLVVGGRSMMDSVFDGVASVQLWDAQTGTLLRTIAENQMAGPAVTLSPDGRTLVTGGNGKILFWDMASGKRLAVINGGSGSPLSLSFSADGKRLAASYMGAGGNAAMYDVATRNQLWLVSTPRQSSPFDVISSALSPDGQVLALGSQNGKVAFFDARNGSFLRFGSLPAEPNASSSSDATRYVAFSADSKLLASGGWHGVAIWNVRDGSLRRQLAGSGGVTFFSDQMKLATGSSLDTGAAYNGQAGVRIWKSY